MKLVIAGQRFGKLDPREGLVVQWHGREQSIPISHHGFVWDQNDFHVLTPVGNYTIKALRNIYRQPGIGVPLVVTKRDSPPGSFLPDRSIFAATLRLNTEASLVAADGELAAGGDLATGGELSAQRCGVQLELYDPLRIKQVYVDGQPQQLASDISAPMAYRLRDEQQTIFDNFTNPASAEGRNRLFITEPYQAGKIPIVFVHGLLSDPFTWVEMANELRAQPGFVDQFQIWGFEYPTGRSFLSSAARLREQLDLARQTMDPFQRDHQLTNMIIVGHSMGGLIAKLQITSSGDQLWRAVANRPFDQLIISGQIRDEVSAAFFFEPSPYVSRVVFMATPHRGSTSAARLIGRIGAALVTMPEELRAGHAELIRNNPGVFSDEVRDRIPTSLDLLEPQSRLLSVIGDLTVHDRVTMHSVIGNHFRSFKQGRTDGVVSVESAREYRALTERYVDTIHTKVNKDPESIQELLFILRQHLDESDHGAIEPIAATLPSQRG